MKKILVLTDFSQPSEAAVDCAFQLSGKGESEIIIYHCMTEHTHVMFQLNNSNNYSIYDITEEKKLTSLKKHAERAKKDNTKVYFLSAGGNLVEGVNSYCQKHSVDLVIMGSTGRSKKARQWGSNTENMVKFTNYPLLIIKEKIKNNTFKNIVYASSFNVKEKDSFIKFLKLLPFDKDAIIHLVSIDTESFFSQPSVLMHQSMDDYIELAYPVKTKKHFYQDYNVKEGIRHFSESLNPDLVAMSTSAKKSIKRILLGNDALDVAHTSPYPVLIINYPD